MLFSGLLSVTSNEAIANPNTQKAIPGTFRVETIATGFLAPWGMAFVNSHELVITERIGTVKILNPDTGTIISLTGVPAVLADGQGGLMDVAVSPDYPDTRKLYFTYTKMVNGQGVTTLAIATREGNRLSHWHDLIVTDSGTNTGRHFGSRIAFDQQGHIFFSVGDRGERPHAQNTSNHAGSILRLNLDGSIPKDNPFLNRKGYRAEIWSYGHRNPQGLVFDVKTGRLWAIEHGPRGGDELNLIEKGRNYGWPIISYGKEYWGPIAVGEGTAKVGMEQPRKVYIPSIAPSGLMVYQGDAFPDWKGNLFTGALKLTHLNRIVLSDEGIPVAEERLLDDMNERIRAIAQGPDGLIYFSTDSGKIARLKPTGIHVWEKNISN